MRANEQTDERVAQYSYHLTYCEATKKWGGESVSGGGSNGDGGQAASVFD